MIKNFFNKHREGVMYLVFGALTTAVNWIVSFVLVLLAVPVEINTAAAWFISVLFAFLTNRKWVFKASGKRFLNEITGFYGARIVSGILDVLMMTAGVRWLGLWFWGVKAFVQVFVIVFNYFASKYFVFKKV